MTSIRMINATQVRQLLPMAQCVAVVREALAAKHDEVINPLRLIMWLDETKTNAIAAMPGCVVPSQALGVKVISLFPGNSGTALDAHQGVVLVVDATNGSFKAIVEAGEVTGIRTAAASGVATDILARKDATSVALIGSGVQARSHLDAMIAVRGITEARVWSRTHANAQKFAKAEAERTGIKVVAAATVEEAVRGADIICGVSGAQEAVVKGEWVKEGTHINAAGACTPATREFDTATVVRSRLYGDRRESVLNEAGEFMIPLQNGDIDASHFLGEVGELLRGEAQGRQSDSDITYFKSLGIAIEDAAAAKYVVDQAEAQNVGTVVPWL